MATLEDAAEELVVRLKGLDSEVEESQHTLEELRGQVEETSREVEQEWSHLTEAVASLLEKLREEQEALEAGAQEALQATAESRGAVHESGTVARSQIADGQAHLEALSGHAAGLDPGIESLVSEAGEAPAHSLAQRAQAVEQELARVLEETRDFLQDEVTSALDELAEDVSERCQALRSELAEERTELLQSVFDAWESKVDDLEDHVSEQGFVASHSHARAVVDWALEECKVACEAHLEAVTALVERAAAPLQELADALQVAGDTLTGTGTDLLADLTNTRESVAQAVSALDTVSELFASYSFMEGS